MTSQDTPQRTIAVVVGTRPEAIKMAPLIIELQKHGRYRTVPILTAQHRELADQPLADFGIVPKHDLNIMQPNQSLFQSTGRLLEGMERVLEEEAPDMVLVQGDTTTVFTSALAALYKRIPVGHVEAGLRTYDKFNPFPEEVNRQLTSRIADLHFAPTDTAKKALLSEGIAPEQIHVTGNTVIDALFMMLDKHPPPPPSEKRQILVTAHRRENHGAPLQSICMALKDLVQAFDDVEITFPVHPNPNVQKTVRDILGETPRINLCEPADYVGFVGLMHNATLIITDSGGVQEEAPSLGCPVLVIREKTERPEAVEAGTVRLVGTDRQRIVKEAKRLLSSPEAYDDMRRKHNPYGDGQACPRIVQAIDDFFAARPTPSQVATS